MKNITLEDVKNAYKKYKSYIYYDNSIFLRTQIAEFEADNFEDRLEDLYNWIEDTSDFYNDYDIDDEIDNIEEKLVDEYFSELLEKIDYWSVPKKFKPENHEDEILRNYNLKNDIIVEKEVMHINAPIEIHVLSVLWIMFEGHYLCEDNNCSYGYVLEKTDDNSEIVTGLRLFKPYYNEYQRWRDKAISSAKSVLSENQNVGIISFDLKNYYHSVRFKYEHLISELNNDNKSVFFSLIIKAINNFYTHTTLEIKDCKEGISILPIGLLSSGILANFYLREFDNKINAELSPIYYGRYVDDILITLPLGTLKKFDSKNDLITKLFENNSILKVNKNKSYDVVNYKNLEIQDEKITVMLFDKKEPTSVLDKFKQEIRKTSSEYKFLPEEELTNQNFEDASAKLIYDGSIKKIRSIKEFQDDRFGISAFLAKKIFLLMQSGKPLNDGTTNQILHFFKKKRILEYMTLWEKIFTYFIINNDLKSLNIFKKRVLKVIDSIEGDSSIDIEKLKRDCNIYLESTLSFSMSLRLEELSNDIDLFGVLQLSFKFRNARMIKKNYTRSILADFVNKFNGKYIDLTSLNVNFNPDKLLKYEYYPRFIHFHEILMAIYNYYLSSDIETKSIMTFYNKAEKIFCEVSQTKGLSEKVISLKNSRRLKKIELQNNKNKNKLKIALANINISDEIFSQDYLSSPQVPLQKQSDIVKILNQAISEDVDLLVLLECSIPHSWLNWLVNFAHQKQIGLIFGLEHKIIDNKAYNLLVELLPVQFENYNSLFPYIRIKKHYSPEEGRILRGHGYEIPQNTRSLPIRTWNNISFTTFNCFELANIKERSRIKSKVDLIFACEWNKDTGYFSNIVESAVRDLHCYFVQSNSAHYGDNRICQPTKSVLRDIMKIKGGENPTLMVGTIDIKKIRDFQVLEYELQREGEFKPTPPDYDKELVRDRIRSSNNIQ